MRRAAWCMLGFTTGAAVTVAVGACASVCPDTTPVVWELGAGTYHLDNRLDPIYLHGDTDYQLVISPDRTSAVETYRRDGKLHETTYTLGPGANSPMRADLTPAHD